MRCWTGLTCLIFLGLAACLPMPSAPLPTQTVELAITVPFLSSSPTIVVPTPTPKIVSPTPGQPSPTPEPVDSTAEFLPNETPLPLPTFYMPPTQAATAVPQPDADSGAIQLLGPGPLSKIVSPLNVYGYAIPGSGNKGRVDLYGEDGRLLASQVLQLNSIYRWAYFYWPLPFKINSVGELGRLTFSTQDQYGRVNAVYSVHVLLLSEGASIINPPGNLKERCVVERPVVGRHNPGGTLTVTGKMRPFNSLPLNVDLVTRDGATIASQQVAVTPAQDDSYVPFSTSLAYSVPGGTWTLLVVRQDDDRIGGTMYLYSHEIYLLP